MYERRKKILFKQMHIYTKERKPQLIAKEALNNSDILCVCFVSYLM